MLPQYASFLSENVPQEDQLSYLNLVSQNENLGALNESDTQAVTKTIKDCISDPITRCKGLLLWKVALEKNGLYIPNWGKEITACLTLSASSSARSLGIKVLNKIVERFGNVSIYNLHFQREIPSLMELILGNLNEEDVVATCCLLSSCIKIFPQISGSKQVTIEEYLVTHFDREGNEIVEAISNVFATLPNCMMYLRRPRHSFPEGYTTLYSKALNALFSLYGDIVSFEMGANGPREENSRLPDFDKMPSCESEGGPPYLCHKMRLFTSVTRCLAKLICSECPRVTVVLEEMLKFINRIILFPEEVARTVDASLINLIYPQLSQCAFMLLEAIILKFLLVEQTDNIIKVALKGTSFHRDVKLSTWRFLNIWIKQCGCGISSKIISEEIVDDLLLDVDIKKEAATRYKIEMCIEALKALNLLFKSSFRFFPKKSINSFIPKILEVTNRVQADPPKSNQYSDDLCRAELYDVLLVLCTIDHKQRTKCIRESVGIFKIGLKDPCCKITSLCNLACQQLVTFLHPKKPASEHIQSVDRNNIVARDESVNPWGIMPQEPELGYVEDRWLHNQPNGQVAPANNLAAPDLYPAEGAFQEVEMDVENSQERPAEQESPTHYAQLGPSNHYSNSRTLSGASSLSGDEEFESEEEVVNEGNGRSVPNKHLPTGIPSARPTNRPNIQTLEAHSTPLAREAKTDEEFSNDNASDVHDVEESEHDSVDEEEEDGSPLYSPKREDKAMSENGREESEEEVEEQSEEDDVDDDNNDDDGDGEDVEELGEHLSEEVTEEIPSEDRLSNRSEERSSPKSEDRLSPKSEERLSPEREQRIPPEDEERPTKKQRLSDVEGFSEAESNHRTTDSNKMDYNEESKPEVNGQQGEGSPEKPTMEEMISDLVEAVTHFEPKQEIEEAEK